MASSARQGDDKISVKRWSPLREQFFDSSGNPLNGGQLFFYVAGSSTKQNTYTTSAGSVANTNPLILDSAGRLQSEVWLTTGVTYKAVLTTSGDTDPPAAAIWTEDNIAGINDASVTLDQWVSGPTPTYVSATSFTLVGDQTSTFHVGRRLKTTNTGGTIYSRISASAYGALTTVTVVNDSGTLDSGLSAVSYGLLSSTNNAMPIITDDYPVISGSADKTKLLRIEVDGFTTATTRVVTVPDADLTMVGAATTQTLTNKTLTSPTINTPTIDSPVINTAVTGTAIASGAQMETATAVDVLVTPGRQQYHPGSAKGWIVYNGTTAAVTTSHNVTSTTDVGTGVHTVTWNVDFSSANYVVVAMAELAANTSVFNQVANGGAVAGSTQILVHNDGNTLIDCDVVRAVAFGDQ